MSSHKATTLVLRCMDYRFVTSLREHMVKLGLKDQYDLVCVAGAAKNMVDPFDPKDPEFVMRQIAIAKRLHHINEVIIVNHLDCGAYADVKFVNLQEERERHEHDLTNAKYKILERFPDLAVRIVLAGIKDDGWIDIEHLRDSI